MKKTCEGRDHFQEGINAVGMPASEEKYLAKVNFESDLNNVFSDFFYGYIGKSELIVGPMFNRKSKRLGDRLAGALKDVDENIEMYQPEKVYCDDYEIIECHELGDKYYKVFAVYTYARNNVHRRMDDEHVIIDDHILIGVEYDKSKQKKATEVLTRHILNEDLAKLIRFVMEKH